MESEGSDLYNYFGVVALDVDCFLGKMARMFSFFSSMESFLAPTGPMYALLKIHLSALSRIVT